MKKNNGARRHPTRRLNTSSLLCIHLGRCRFGLGCSCTRLGCEGSLTWCLRRGCVRTTLPRSRVEHHDREWTENDMHISRKRGTETDAARVDLGQVVIKRVPAAADAAINTREVKGCTLERARSIQGEVEGAEASTKRDAHTHTHTQRHTGS